MEDFSFSSFITTEHISHYHSTGLASTGSVDDNDVVLMENHEVITTYIIHSRMMNKKSGTHKQNTNPHTDEISSES